MYFVLLAIATAASAQTPSDVTLRYNEALSTKNKESKIAQLRDIVAQWPNFLNARYALGTQYYYDKNFQQAIPQYEYILNNPALIDSNPSLKQVLSGVDLRALIALGYNDIGIRYLGRSMPDSAIVVIEKAIALQAENAAFHYNLGNAYLLKDSYNQAIAAYKRSLQYDANFVPSLNNLGNAYWFLGNFREAETYYLRAVELAPNNAKAQSNLQRVQEKLQLEGVLARIDSAVAADNPALAQTLYDRAEAADPNLPALKSRVSAIRRAQQRVQLYESAMQAQRAGNPSEALRFLNRLPKSYRDTGSLITQIRAAMTPTTPPAPSKPDLSPARAAFEAGQFAEARQILNAIADKDGLPVDGRRLSARVDSALRYIAATNYADSLRRVAALQNSEDTNGEAGDRDAALPADTGGRGERDLPIEWILGMALVAILGYGWFVISKKRRAGEQTGAVAMAGAPANFKSGGIGSPPAKKPAGPASGAVGAIPKPPAKPELDPDDPGTQELFENLVSDNGSVEIFEIMDRDEPEPPEKPAEPKPEAEPAKGKKKKKVETPAEPADPPEPAKRNDTEQEAFLSLIDDDDVPPSRLTGDTSSGSSQGDITHTIDMSQFRVRKIGRYIIEKEIGRGAAGRIYKAWDPKLDRTVVIKTVSYSITATPEEIKRLKARVYIEARAAAKLNQPNIVVVYDVEDEPTFSYIVMEHIEGPDLREVLDREKRIKPEKSIHFVTQVCKALQFAHDSNIIHRDIKPSNILIVDNSKVKVTDFGIAKVTNHLTLTQTGRVVGTPSYMAPEQIEGLEVDARADIFSLGVVFYELITGQRPFSGDSLAALAYKIVHVEPAPPSLVNVELPDTYDEILNRAMAKDPEKRYASVTEFMNALNKAKSKMASS